MTAPKRNKRERELLALIGETAYVALADQFGGTDIYIPEKAEGSKLAEAIGLDAARILAEEYRRDQLVVPLSRELRAHYYRRQGETPVVIARRLGMSRQGVQRIFSEAEKRQLAARQFELFQPTQN